jgi:hypothetical protein
VHPEFLPTRFQLAFGGYLGGSTSLELNDRTLVFTVRDGPFETVERVDIVPTDAQWTSFRQDVDALKLWRWQPEYSNHHVLDGGFWSLELAYADRDISAHGSNNYPDGTGRPTNSPDQSPEFLRLLRAVHALTGRDMNADRAEED